MKQKRKLSNGIEIRHLSNEELLNDVTLLEQYIKSWEVGFGRTGYKDRLIWLLKMPTKVAIACTPKNEVIGGLLRSLDIEKDLYLFNNLYSIKGASSVPIGVPLIKSLISDKKICIGFPNELAKIPYKRAGFVRLQQFERRKLKTDKSIKLRTIDWENNEMIEKGRILPLSHDVAKYITVREKWRYGTNMDDREYFIVKVDNLIENGTYAIVSHYKPKNIVHILELKYRDKSDALKLLETIRQASVAWQAKETNMIVNTINESDLPLDNFQSQPIIGYNISSGNNIQIRDGTNDVY